MAWYSEYYLGYYFKPHKGSFRLKKKYEIDVDFSLDIISESTFGGNGPG